MLATRNVMDEPEDLLQLVLGMTSPGLFNEVFAEGPQQPEDRLSEWFDQKTATFGGADVVETVRRLVGSVQRFDFGGRTARAGWRTSSRRSPSLGC